MGRFSDPKIRNFDRTVCSGLYVNFISYNRWFSV